MKASSLFGPSRLRPPAFAPVLGVGHFGHALALALALQLLAFALAADAKPVMQWSGTDIAGEGSLVAMAAVWLAQLRASRPGGRVTDWLCVGLAGLLLGQWADLLDEFWRLPKAVVWDNVLESTLLPLGALCLTIGLHHWRLEQRALGEQLVKRERLFREHRSVDAVTQLGDAGYMAAQIAIEQQQGRPGALVMLALEDGVGEGAGEGAGTLAGIAREHGLAEADRLLQALTHLLLLNLRAQDLLCRYAGVY